MDPGAIAFTQSRDYAAPKKVCAACSLREQCTQNKSRRTVKRHLRQEELDAMREASRSRQARRDIKVRQHLMERTFARGTLYGFDRARWRGLWRVQIQQYLVSSIQNIDVLLRYGNRPRRNLSMLVREGTRAFTRAVWLVLCWMKDLIWSETNSILSSVFASLNFR